MHEYSEPALPLSRDGFRHALGVGHGRARMHLDAFGVAPFRQDVLDAATACQVYDPQVEGFPTGWFADFCEKADVVEEFIQRKPGTTHWDRVWRCELLGEFARRGHQGAREALYRSCEPAEHKGVYGATQIVALDGAAGLAFIAAQMGSLIRTNPAFKIDDDTLWRFDVDHGDGAALRLLTPLATTDTAIGAYLAQIAELELASQSQKRSRAPVEQTLAAILSADRSLYGLRAWARQADPSELGAIVEVALNDSRPLVVENALRCLSGCRDLPLHRELLPLLKNDQAVVRLLAAATLGHHKDDLLHSVGVDLLRRDLAVALELLRKNAREEDVDSIAGALLPFDDVEYQHNIAFDIVQLLRDNRQLRAPALALYAYEHSPCQHCRHTAVQQLLEWKACPDWLLTEARFDASEDVRDLVTIGTAL